MKCTSFRGELEAIRRKEIEELKAALQAHGGEYEFGESLEDRPEVTVNIHYEWETVRVGFVGLDGAGRPYLCGDVVEEYAGYYTEEASEVDANDVMTGDMLYIISMMDDPE